MLHLGNAYVLNYRKVTERFIGSIASIKFYVKN